MKKILLADDEEMVLEVTRAMLTQIGYDVLAAPDGGEALEMFRLHHTDIGLVVLDYHMPVFDGFECLRRIRELSLDVPVLISSGYGSVISDTELNNYSAQGIIQKPFALEDLRKKVSQYL